MACSLASAIVAHKEQGATGAKPDVSQCAQAPRVIDSFHDSFTVRQNPTQHAHVFTLHPTPRTRGRNNERRGRSHTICVDSSLARAAGLPIDRGRR